VLLGVKRESTDINIFEQKLSFFCPVFSNEIQSRLVRLRGPIFWDKKRLNFSFSIKKKESSHVRAQRKKERERGREVIVCKDNNKARRK